ncbi:MAG: DNA polymerase III subunit beta [Gammaproteobacteria bacterium]
MKFEVDRNSFLDPLQAVAGVVERRQTMPILGNLLLGAEGKRLTVTGSDMEVELAAELGDVEIVEEGEITVPARKLVDICRALPDGVKIAVDLDKGKMVVKAGRSRFALATLPAADFPLVEDIGVQREFALPGAKFKNLLSRAAFSMAQQDVRYYLNGLLIETSEGRLRVVATDGHRLALCDLEAAFPADTSKQQMILPRKGVLELQRLLGDKEENVKVLIGSNHFRVELPGARFTSKLIDGRFPEYERVLPKGGDKVLIAETRSLRESLSRAAILSNEKYRGVRLQLDKNRLKVLAHNPEQEEAEDEVEVEYVGEALEIGFNVTYLLDALNAIIDQKVSVGFTDSNSSCLISSPSDSSCRYVVMPMRL